MIWCRLLDEYYSHGANNQGNHYVFQVVAQPYLDKAYLNQTAV